MEYRVSVPGDKSISHRAILLGSIAEGTTEINRLSSAQDCVTTIACMRQLGVQIEQNLEGAMTIYGRGLESLAKPVSKLDVGNSGTTIRLLMGMLAGSSFSSTLVGDESISRRPMDRVVIPLTKMGAQITGEKDGRFTPIHISGTNLSPIRYVLPVASAQVKSAVLLAGLQAKGVTEVVEKSLTRDHTERMMKHFGLEIRVRENEVHLKGKQKLEATQVCVPGDFSSAAFLLAAAMLSPNLKVTVEDVGINPLRTGILEVFQQMGAEVVVEQTGMLGYEPVGNVTVYRENLIGVHIKGDIISRLIDEIPILAVVATQAKGETIVSDATELKVKETNRISVMVEGLKKLGVLVVEKEDGFCIEGPIRLSGGLCHSYGDHRIAMALTLLNLVSKDEVIIKGKECMNISFPEFERLLFPLLYAVR